MVVLRSPNQVRTPSQRGIRVVVLRSPDQARTPSPRRIHAGLQNKTLS